MKQALFIDRDGTILVEPADEQIDSFDKFEFLPGVIRNLHFIRTKLDFEFVMVSNQDGLGTSSYPEDTFWPTHNLMLNTLRGEGITFDDILIDRSFPSDNLPTRKPGTAMLTRYMTGEYDLANSYDERFGGDLSHVVVMQHVKKEVIDKFIAELESTMTAISATEANT